MPETYWRERIVSLMAQVPGDEPEPVMVPAGELQPGDVIEFSGLPLTVESVERVDRFVEVTATGDHRAEVRYLPFESVKVLSEGRE